MINEGEGINKDETVEVEVHEATRAAEILDGLRGQDQERAITLAGDVSSINETERTVQLTFASEYPYFRRSLNALEVLEMSDNAANLDRLNSGGALLSEHKRDDQIGVVMRAWIGADKRAHAIVKFSRSDRGQDFFQDVIDGIRRNVSFHYQIYDGKVTAGKRGSNEPDTFTATSWEATEISIVSVPADPSIGVGRNDEVIGEVPVPIVPAIVEEQRSKEVTPIATTQTKRGSEMEREDQILEFGKKFGADEMARAFALDPNKSLEDFRAALLAEHNAKTVVVETTPKQPTDLELSRKEVKEYSILRAISAMVSGKRDGFEFECSEEITKRLNRAPQTVNGIYVPVDIQMRGARDLSVGLGSQPGDGGALVGTTHLSSAFIDVLRSKMLMIGLGARMMSGLVGDVDIPRQDSSATGYWVAEGVAPTESQLGVGQLSLTPKTVGAVTEFTRKLLLQSAPSVEQLVFADLAAVIARSIDLAIINGSGASGQPTGILNTTGVDEITQSGSGTTFDWSDAVEMETAIQADNAPEGFAYLTTPSVRGTLKTRPKIGTTYPVFLCGENNQMNGYRVPVTTQMPAASMIFGDYTQVIVGEWGVLELVANPFSSGFRAGSIEVRGLQSVDVAIRYPESFKKIEGVFA